MLLWQVMFFPCNPIATMKFGGAYIATTRGIDLAGQSLPDCSTGFCKGNHSRLLLLHGLSSVAKLRSALLQYFHLLKM